MTALIDRQASSTTITLPNGQRLAFSYDTVVGFTTKDAPRTWAVSENYWGATTGKHINALDGGTAEAKRRRLKRPEFTAALDAAFA